MQRTHFIYHSVSESELLKLFYLFTFVIQFLKMIHPLLEDTITAIATPNGFGAISIIRISGNKAIPVADAIFKG